MTKKRCNYCNEFISPYTAYLRLEDGTYWHWEHFMPYIAERMPVQKGVK